MQLRRTASPAEDKVVQAGWTARVFAPIGRRRTFSLSRQAGGDIVDLGQSPIEEDEVPNKTGGQPPIKLISFITVVLLPFLASLYYFIFVATDQYTAEARFAVRSLADQSQLEGSDSSVISLDAATQDAYVVTSFIQSAELLRRLGKTIDYRSVFAGPDVDFFSRFDRDEPVESFLKYWKKQVTAFIDGPSGIITLRVRTFDPENSKKLASAIVAESEQLINELNQRAQQDMVASIRREVERTGEGYADALAALNRFQVGSGLLSPEMQAMETGKLLAGLLAQKLELETRLFVLKQSSAEKSPAYEQLARTKLSLDSQVEKLRSELTGPENASVATTLLTFSKLETDRLVAEKLYEAARSNYDAALAASLRKALYLTVFVPPSMPEESLYPKRFSTPFIIALGLLVFWATLMLLWASVEDHKA